MALEEIIENKDVLDEYLSKMRVNGKLANTTLHRRLLYKGNETAVFCEKILQKYSFKMRELNYFIKSNCTATVYCEYCGKKIEDITKNKKYCSRECEEKSGFVMDRSKVVERIKESIKDGNEEFSKKFGLSKEKPQDVDTNMTSIKENEQKARIYIANLTDSTGAANISKHRAALKHGNEDALFINNILQEYGITIRELKYILDKNFIGISFYCKVCGKRLNDIFHDFCSKACSYASSDRKEKYKKTCLEKYGVENSTASPIIQERMKKTNLERRGVEYNFQAEDVKAKSKKTWKEKYGVDNPNKSDIVKEKIARTTKEKRYSDFLTLLKRLNLQLLNTYEEYLDFDKLKLKCLTCGKEYEADFSVSNQLIERCPVCTQPYSSVAEKEILDFINSIVQTEHVCRDRSVIPPYELDIYLPEYSLAIEHDGLYWHSENKGLVDRNYHSIKTDACAEKGIQLIHVFENEWLSKRDIIESIIRNKVGKATNRIYARECETIALDNTVYKEFLEKNHIQGYAAAAKRLGLLYNGELVACAGIGGSRFKEDETELIRFCVKLNTQVVGALSKLIKNSSIKHLVSYVDRRYFNGKGYESSGFKYLYTTKPGYVYANKTSTLSRFQCQKHKLKELLGDAYDENLTEAENMYCAGYYQLYDCGMLKYEYTAR